MYSHTGVVEVAADGVFVSEAIGKVSLTPMTAWAKRGVDGRVTVPAHERPHRRRRAAGGGEAKKQMVKKYDARFRWDDEGFSEALPVFDFQPAPGLRLWVLPYDLKEKRLVLPAGLEFLTHH